MFVGKKSEPFVGALGNIFEWYNFALFMPFLPIISKQFFPADGGGYNDVITFLVLSMGLFTRPLGSAVFGPIGDKFGRTRAISWSILLMTFSTFGMALLPGYDSIGIAAPLLLAFFRALQGVSMGGEYTSAMVHLVEKAPSNRRGFFGALSDAGSNIGVLLGGQSLILLYLFFSNDEIYSYAWRIPFAFSLILIPFAFLLPKGVATEKKSSEKSSMITVLLAHKKEMFCTLFITAFSAIAFYSLLTFLPYYLNSINILSLEDATKCSNIATLIMISFIFLSGYLSDKFSRKPFLLVGIIGAGISLGIMLISSQKSVLFWMVFNGICGAFLGIYYSCRAAFFAEAFPKNIRCTAVSISLSLAQSIFGGLCPAVTLRLTHISSFFALIPIVCVSVTAIYCLTLIEDRTGKGLV